MSFSVQHVRYTFECDACGLVEKHDDSDLPDAEGHRTRVWQNVNISAWQYFCCPTCIEKLNAIVLARPRAEEKARAELVAACAHTYAQRGFIAQCTKCQTFKP